MSLYRSKKIPLVQLLAKNLFVIMAYFTAAQAYAGVAAYVDRTDIRTNETFTLVVEANQAINSSPDLSVLPKKVLILGNSSYRRSSTVNGVSETLTGWKVQLMIKEEGVYTIPEIPFGGETTKPIQITVKPGTNTFGEEAEAKSIMLTSEVNKKSVYVQEQLVLTIKLFRSVQTQYAKLSTPTVEDTLFEQLGEDIQYESIIDGKRYFIIERKYAIFPQNSGSLTIPKIIFNADVLDQKSGSGYGRLLGRTRPVTLSTEAITIKVEPYPANHSGLWLPAKKLTLEAKWNDVKQKIVGEPSTWSLAIKGVGLHENQLPEIELPEIDGVKWYPDNAQKNRYLSTDGITGERVMRVAVVPTKSGKIQLPELKIRWFNTDSKQYEVAKLSPQTIDILPNPEQTTAVTMSSAPQQASNGSVDAQIIFDPGYWRWLTYLFGLLWLATLVALLTRKQQSKALYSESITSTTETNNKKQLLKACTENNAQQAYQFLLNWLNEINTRSPNHQSLQQFIKKLNDAQVIEELTHLESSLFSHQPSAWQNGKQLKNLLNTVEKQLTQRQQSTDKQSIPPLYPN